MKIYISGKITGLDIAVAEDLFEAAENKLKSAGMEPVNPCKILPYDPKHTWEDYMVEDVRALFKCNAILMLDNWQDSRGARVEHAIAKELGLKVFYSQNHNFF